MVTIEDEGFYNSNATRIMATITYGVCRTGNDGLRREPGEDGALYKSGACGYDANSHGTRRRWVPKSDDRCQTCGQENSANGDVFKHVSDEGASACTRFIIILDDGIYVRTVKGPKGQLFLRWTRQWF